MQREKEKIRRKKEKVTSLLLAVIVIALSLLKLSDLHEVGIYAGGSWVGRVLYPFFHSGIIHATLNAWCLISLVFIYNIRLQRLILAYIVAVTFPIDTLSQVLPISALPTVGLSGIVFFLFGSISLEVRRKLYYQAWMVFYLIVGFVFPYTNSWLHLYCYLCGILSSLLNYPIVICKKK